MKIHYLLLSTILLTLSTLKLSGQPNKPCNNFDCAYKKADNLLKNKEYQKALDNLDSAEGYLTDTNTKEKEQIKQLRRRLFVAIEKEKEDAKRARDEAKRQTEIAKAAEAKAKAVLDKTYFYNDIFGLAYDKDKKAYGFIDKDLNTKINFKYQEALPFDYTGFAKVKKGGIYFNIDTIGREYQLATESYQLNTNIRAIDLREKNLKTIPLPIFQNNQLELLMFSLNDLKNLNDDIGKLTNLFLLDLRLNKLKKLPIYIGKLDRLTYLNLQGNWLTELTPEIGKLKNLRYLNLWANQLTSLPDEIKNLENLKELYLGYNPISKEEKERIIKLLPYCKISFDSSPPQ
jgi:hypothetical protein